MARMTGKIIIEFNAFSGPDSPDARPLVKEALTTDGMSSLVYSLEKALDAHIGSGWSITSDSLMIDGEALEL